MSHAAYDTHPHKRRRRKNDGRSAVDHLADRAPRAIRPQAEAAALAVDKLVTGYVRAKTAARSPQYAPVRRRIRQYGVAAMVVAIGVGLIAWRPSRQALGQAVKGEGPIAAFVRQLTKELRSLIP